MGLIKGELYTIIKHPNRPRHWNHKGRMDEYMGRLVRATRGGSYSLSCVPEGWVAQSTSWAWEESDFRAVPRTTRGALALI